MFTTFKCSNNNPELCIDNPLRQQIEDNTFHTWSTMKQITFKSIEDDNIEKNIHGIPILGNMYLHMYDLCPNAKTYTYINGDIIGQADFVDTISAILATPTITDFLMVGQRTNVQWNKDNNVKLSSSSFDNHFEKGALFRTDAQDYFTVTKNAIDWNSIPPFVIGRRGYDNWLVDHVYHNPKVALIDGTKTVRMIHQTDTDGNMAHGGSHKKTRDNIEYNRDLGNGQYDHGTTTHAEWSTYRKKDGTIVVTDHLQER